MAVRWIFKGDPYRAALLQGRALGELRTLHEAMRFQGLSNLTRTVTFPDGSVIHCHSVFGQDIVTLIPAQAVARIVPSPTIYETFIRRKRPIALIACEIWYKVHDWTFKWPNGDVDSGSTEGGSCSTTVRILHHKSIVFSETEEWEEEGGWDIYQYNQYRNAPYRPLYGPGFVVGPSREVGLGAILPQDWVVTVRWASRSEPNKRITFSEAFPDYPFVSIEGRSIPIVGEVRAGGNTYLSETTKWSFSRDYDTGEATEKYEYTREIEWTGQKAELFIDGESVYTVKYGSGRELSTFWKISKYHRYWDDEPESVESDGTYEYSGYIWGLYYSVFPTTENPFPEETFWIKETLSLEGEENVKL